MISEGSAPIFHGGSPRNYLQSDILLGLLIFIYQRTVAYV